MGLFDTFKKGDSNDMTNVIKNQVLVKGKYIHCAKACIGEDLSGNLQDKEKVCLAICLDKLHLRYEPYKYEIMNAIRNTQPLKLN